MDQFKLIAQFTIDRESTEFNNLKEKMQTFAAEDPRERQNAVSLHQENIDFHDENQQYIVELTYEATIYVDNSHISTMITLPDVIIKHA